MKQLFLFCSLGLALAASPVTLQTACPPTLAQDGVAVPLTCSGLGARVTATPDSVWLVYFNDNYGGGDYDYNDLAARVSFNRTGTEASISFIGALASAEDRLIVETSYATVPVFTNRASVGTTVRVVVTPNTIVPFALATPDGGYYRAGPVVFNADDTIHAWVVEETREGGREPGTVPEPVTLGVVGAGLLLIYVAGVWRGHVSA